MKFESQWLSYKKKTPHQVERASPKTPAGKEIEQLHEEFEERAAIREYDGGSPRSEAECLAIQDVFDMLPGQGRKDMTVEEFQAAMEVFAMLAQARDQKEVRR